MSSGATLSPAALLRSKMLDPGRWPHPEIPASQMLWVLTLIGFQSMGEYWLRHVRPDLTGAFAAGIDIGVADLFQATVGMDVAEWSPTARARIRLPIRERGCGLREAVDGQFGQFVGGMAQSVSALVTRTSAQNITVVGRLNSPAIIGLFGEG